MNREIERAIKASNRLLRELDGVFPGHTPSGGKFRWEWSESLFSLVPVYRDGSDYEGFDPQPVKDYFCACGKNRRVHKASCDGLLTAKTRMQKVKTCGLEGEFESYKDVWLLCRWLAPPSLEDWCDMMGTDTDYPKGGRYVPVHRGPMCVVINPRCDPEDYAKVTRTVITMMREHELKRKEEKQAREDKAKQIIAPIERNGEVIAEPPKGSNYHRVYDEVKQRLKHRNPDGTIGWTKEVETKGDAAAPPPLKESNIHVS